MFTFLIKILKSIHNSDIRFIFYEKYSLIVGIIFINLDRLFYGSKLVISPPYKIWGRIRFLIYGNGSISIGKNFHAVSTRRRSFLTIFSPCQITTIGDAQIVLGDHVGLNGTTILARKNIHIGDNTMIAPNVIIMDHNGHVSWPCNERWNNRDSPAEIIIENDVWIGMNCIVLKGVKIGAGSIIGAGSVVVSDVESGCLFAGNPAKKIKSLKD